MVVDAQNRGALDWRCRASVLDAGRINDHVAPVAVDAPRQGGLQITLPTALLRFPSLKYPIYACKKNDPAVHAPLRVSGGARQSNVSGDTTAVASGARRFTV
jgi:hypothetical protein